MSSLYSNENIESIVNFLVLQLMRDLAISYADRRHAFFYCRALRWTFFIFFTWNILTLALPSIDPNFLDTRRIDFEWNYSSHYFIGRILMEQFLNVIFQSNCSNVIFCARIASISFSEIKYFCLQKIHLQVKYQLNFFTNLPPVSCVQTQTCRDLKKCIDGHYEQFNSSHKLSSSNFAV